MSSNLRLVSISRNWLRDEIYRRCASYRPRKDLGSVRWRYTIFPCVQLTIKAARAFSVNSSKYRRQQQHWRRFPSIILPRYSEFVVASSSLSHAQRCGDVSGRRRFPFIAPALCCRQLYDNAGGCLMTLWALTWCWRYTRDWCSTVDKRSTSDENDSSGWELDVTWPKVLDAVNVNQSVNQSICIGLKL